jgi:hypothetical protein
MTRRADAHAGLRRALAAMAPAEICESSMSAWASATFTGARHIVVMEFAPDQADAAEAFAAGLAEAEFALPGHIVADIAVASSATSAAGRQIMIEALTVEDV